MDTRPRTWGNPSVNASDIQKKIYSNDIKDLGKEEQDSID